MRAATLGTVYCLHLISEKYVPSNLHQKSTHFFDTIEKKPHKFFFQVNLTVYLIVFEV